MTLASRIGVMNHGEIVQVGKPSDIYEFPSSRFVADFIGSVNMFEGRLIEDEPDYVRVASNELGGTFHVSHGVSAAPDAIVWVALRPEKIQVSRERPDGTKTIACRASSPRSRIAAISPSISCVSPAAVRFGSPSPIRFARARMRGSAGTTRYGCPGIPPVRWS